MAVFRSVTAVACVTILSVPLQNERGQIKWESGADICTEDSVKYFTFYNMLSNITAD